MLHHVMPVEFALYVYIVQNDL